MNIQAVSLVLPTSYAAGTGTLASTETVADLVEHTSIDIPVTSLQEKNIEIYAIEVALAPAAVPGPLWCWVEISQYPASNNVQWPWPYPASAAYYKALGGGGGALPPAAPHIEVSGLGGAAGTLGHGISLPWAIHSNWARVIVQTPVAASLPNAYWVVQCFITGKG